MRCRNCRNLSFPFTVFFALLFLIGLDTRPLSAQQKLVSCKPAAERTGPEGCWIIASKKVGTLSTAPVFWTLDTYPTQETAESARTSQSEVVHALGKIWLFTVGEKLSAPSHGQRVSEIGPLPIQAGEDYTAQYMEAILDPGAVSKTHVHAGPEAFYTETGQSCLETPAGMQIGDKDKSVIVPEGEPMELVATGTQKRRGIVLVLHASSRPATTIIDTWQSKGLCKSPAS
jgi:quercetin dioxygenase-like cupin family protein